MLSQELANKQSALLPFFKTGFLEREHTVFQFHFTGAESFYLVVERETFILEAGEHEAPTLTLTVSDHETCWGLLNGSVDGMQAFMNGDYRADGNIVLSQLLLYLFKSDDPTIPHEVQD